MANLVGGLKASFTRRNAWRLGHFKWITLYYPSLSRLSRWHSVQKLGDIEKGWRRIYVAQSRKHNLELKLTKISSLKPILKINYDKNTKFCNRIHIKLYSGFRVNCYHDSYLCRAIKRSRKRNLELKLTKKSPFKPILKINFDENTKFCNWISIKLYSGFKVNSYHDSFYALSLSKYSSAPGGRLTCE